MPRLSIEVDGDTHRRAKVAAALRGQTLSGLVRAILDRIIEGVDSEAEAFVGSEPEAPASPGSEEL